jgi:hypothetical protein
VAVVVVIILTLLLVETVVVELVATLMHPLVEFQEQLTLAAVAAVLMVAV